MEKTGAHQVRVMSFVPQKGTPMARVHAPDIVRELLIIAVLRITFPDRLIPASLDVDGSENLISRLNAGANVVTSFVPPNMGMAGVAQPQFNIDNGLRTVDSILSILKAANMQPASFSKYIEWMERERGLLKLKRPLHESARGSV